jgi:predicted DNA-binding transcriptional regulator AlpA
MKKTNATLHRPPKVRTKLELAKRIGIARSTLDRYLTMPGAPERKADGWPLEEVLAFIASRAETEATLGKAAADIRKLKAEEIGLRCEKMRFALQRERGEFVERAKVAKTIVEFATAIRGHLEAKLVNEWPSVVSGLDTAQARVYGKKLFDQIVAEHQRYASLWEGV